MDRASEGSWSFIYLRTCIGGIIKIWEVTVKTIQGWTYLSRSWVHMILIFELKLHVFWIWRLSTIRLCCRKYHPFRFNRYYINLLSFSFKISFDSFKSSDSLGLSLKKSLVSFSSFILINNVQLFCFHVNRFWKVRFLYYLKFQISISFFGSFLNWRFLPSK